MALNLNTLSPLILYTLPGNSGTQELNNVNIEKPPPKDNLKMEREELSQTDMKHI